MSRHIIENNPCPKCGKPTYSGDVHTCTPKPKMTLRELMDLNELNRPVCPECEEPLEGGVLSYYPHQQCARAIEAKRNAAHLLYEACHAISTWRQSGSPLDPEEEKQAFALVEQAILAAQPKEESNA